MRFEFSLERAEFVDRPNRFLVIAQLESGDVVRAHCADPGRLRELLRPGATVYLSRSQRPGRTTTHDLRLVQHPDTGALVSIVSRLPNALFREAVMADGLGVFSPPITLRSEVPMPFAHGRVRSRVDYVLIDGLQRAWWVEIKSVTLVVNGIAYFPDAVTERGRRHVMELAQLAREGAHAAICFIVQRPDATEVRPEWDRDPAFAQALADAAADGVYLFGWRASVTLEGVQIAGRIPVVPDRLRQETD